MLVEVKELTLQEILLNLKDFINNEFLVVDTFYDDATMVCSLLLVEVDEYDEMSVLTELNTLPADAFAADGTLNSKYRLQWKQGDNTYNFADFTQFFKLIYR